MNNLTLMGRLTRDPEITYTKGNEPITIARYTLAVDSGRKDQNGNYEADFIPCTAFGKQADFADKYLQKGDKILLSAHVTHSSYQDKNGDTKYATNIIVDRQEFAEKKNDMNSVKDTVTLAKEAAASLDTSSKNKSKDKSSATIHVNL